MFSVYSPNGQPWCLTISLFRQRVIITLGLTRELLGFDVTIDDRMVFCIPRSQRL